MTDLVKLFATDPLKLTRKDHEAMVKEFRGMRHQFELGNTRAGSAKQTEAQKAANSILDKLDIDLGDL